MRIFVALASLALALPAAAGDWYASVYGGVNFDNVIDLPFVESQTGGVVGGTVGRSTPVPGLRIEADLSYRTNDVDIFGGVVTAKHDTSALLFNAAYDIDVDDPKAKPYVLLGVGYAHTEASALGISLDASDIAYQAGVGINFNVWAGSRLGIGYRYLQGPKLEFGPVEISDGTNHSAIAQLTFDL